MRSSSTSPARRGAVLALLLLLAACGGDDPAVLRVVPVAPLAGCARAGATRTVLFTALGEGGQQRLALDAESGAVALADVPADVRQVSVEALGPGGALVAAGKSAPLPAFAAGDQLEVPVAMVPPGGACATGRLADAIAAPVVVSVPAGALIIGGEMATGPSVAVTRYDADAATLASVEVPAALRDARGFRGARAVALGAGRVALVGGPLPAYVVYDDGVGFGAPGLFEARAFHALVAIDDHRVLVAGGCTTLLGATCAPGTGLRSTRVLDVGTGDVAIGPNLSAVRIGGDAWLEPQPGGGVRVAIAGGVDADGAPLATIDRIDLDAGTASASAAAAGAPLRLTSGGAMLLTADGVTSSVSVGGGVRALPARPASTAAASIVLEDGLVWSVGGERGDRVQVFSPMSGRWTQATLVGDPVPVVWHDAGATRLADGTVLMVGGRDAFGPVAGIWRLRPSLVGPWAGQVTVTPAGSDGPPTLVPVDVGAVERAASWTLTAGAGAIVGGITPATGTLRATVGALGGAVVVLGDGAKVRLADGEVARLDGDAGCVGTVAVGWTAGPHALQVDRRADQLRVTLDDVVVLACAPAAAPVAGTWGVAPLDAGARVEIATVTLERAP